MSVHVAPIYIAMETNVSMFLAIQSSRTPAHPQHAKTNILSEPVAMGLRHCIDYISTVPQPKGRSGLALTTNRDQKRHWMANWVTPPPAKTPQNKCCELAGGRRFGQYIDHVPTGPQPKEHSSSNGFGFEMEQPSLQMPFLPLLRLVIS